MKRYATLRIYYGEDFLDQCVRSIQDCYDKVLLFWTDKPRGHAAGWEFKGQWYEFPKPIEPNIIDIMESLCEEFPTKVEMIYDPVLTDMGQFNHQVNDIILPNYDKPDLISLVEPDHVYPAGGHAIAMDMFYAMKTETAPTHKIEFWKGTNYIIPPRAHRPADVFWDMSNIQEVPQCRRHADSVWHWGIPFVEYWTPDFGMCLSDRNMWWKFLVTFAASTYSGDSMPSEDWYDKWLNWKPGDTDLEMSKGWEHNIPYVIPYNGPIPELIQEKYKL